MKRNLIITAIVLFIFIIFGLWIRAKINHAVKTELINKTLHDSLVLATNTIKKNNLEIEIIKHKNDSLDKEIEIRDKNNAIVLSKLTKLEIKHKDTVSVVITDPSDTIYNRISEKFPSHGQPLIYPFAEVQIRGIYRNILDKDYLQDRLELTEHRLNIQDEAVNLQQKQISNLKGQISILDQNNKEIQKTYDLLKSDNETKRKQLNRTKFWSKVKTGVIIVVGTIAVVK